eukprot:5967605-Prymnesium_polylepis.1
MHTTPLSLRRLRKDLLGRDRRLREHLLHRLGLLALAQLALRLELERDLVVIPPAQCDPRVAEALPDRLVVVPVGLVG